MADNPNTVYVAEDHKLADAVIQLLAGKGIEAEAVSIPGHAETDPLTGASAGVTPEEFEIRVTDATKAADAKELLTEAVAASMKKAIRDKRASRTGTATATCEDCGKPSDWPAAAMGTTEVCPHCGGYMDIPDPEEDDWSGVDFGEDEDAKEEKEETEK
jgi:rRNA maturation protein Nop10